MSFQRHFLVAATLLGFAAWISTSAATPSTEPSTASRVARELAASSQSVPRTAQQTTDSVGPDVTVIDIRDVTNWTSGGGTTCPPGYGGGDCRGYSVGTDSCNVGSVALDWCDDGVNNGCRSRTGPYHPVEPTYSDHPVIGQNLYRLKDGRFQQIGQSFLKHGFAALNTPDTACAWNDGGTPNTSCIAPGFGEPGYQDVLGVGCTDFYSSSLNGSRTMGRRSQTDPATGAHPVNPDGSSEADDAYDQRIVVRESDLDPAQNPGAVYFAEGHYVVRDDARAGSSLPTAELSRGGTADCPGYDCLGINGLNNASYREITVGPPTSFHLSFIGETVRERAAIFAWEAADPAVEMAFVDRETFFPGEEAGNGPVPGAPAPGTFYPDHWVLERFHVARRVTDSGAGPFPFHVEYAIHNMNSRTAADGFVVDFPSNTSIDNVGFYGIAHHSGEPYDTSDWTIEVDEATGLVTWAAVDAGDATNALRWGTTFNFWFDAERRPTSEKVDLFEVDELLPVLYGDSIFVDGFETGDILQWSTPGP